MSIVDRRLLRTTCMRAWDLEGTCRSYCFNIGVKFSEGLSSFLSRLKKTIATNARSNMNDRHLLYSIKEFLLTLRYDGRILFDDEPSQTSLTTLKKLVSDAICRNAGTTFESCPFLKESTPFFFIYILLHSVWLEAAFASPGHPAVDLLKPDEIWGDC